MKCNTTHPWGSQPSPSQPFPFSSWPWFEPSTMIAHQHSPALPQRELWALGLLQSGGGHRWEGWRVVGGSHLLCPWSRVGPCAQLEWSLVFSFQIQLKVWASQKWLRFSMLTCLYGLHPVDLLSSGASSGTLLFPQGLGGEQWDEGWLDTTTALPWKSDTWGPWPLLSPSQNVCAGAAINRAVLTRRCNPRRLSLGLICITLSGARERDAPREGRGLCRGFGLVPSVLARGGD